MSLCWKYFGNLWFPERIVFRRCSRNLRFIEMNGKKNTVKDECLRLRDAKETERVKSKGGSLAI
jgi:hypothetical protein